MGPDSPIKSIEPIIVELCKCLNQMNAPLDCGQVLMLTNDLIETTGTKEKCLEFVKKNCGIDESAETHKLGAGYWRGFMSRNRHELETKHRTKFSSLRSKWCTYENFEWMYDSVYEEMIHAGVARHLDEPVWMNEKGEIVDEEDAFGTKVDVELIHPDWCLVADEVGSNTNMQKDGHYGGRLHVTGKGEAAKLAGSTSDAHFTFLCFTALTGDPVMGVIVFEGLTVDPEWATGINYFLEGTEGTDSGTKITMKWGPGNVLEGGPSCVFQGKELPCCICANPSGGMTSELLAGIFAQMDKIGIYT